MKKLFNILFGLVFAFAMFSCGNKSTEETKEEETNVETATDPVEEIEVIELEEEEDITDWCPNFLLNDHKKITFTF